VVDDPLPLLLLVPLTVVWVLPSITVRVVPLVGTGMSRPFTVTCGCGLGESVGPPLCAWTFTCTVLLLEALLAPEEEGDASEAAAAVSALPLTGAADTGAAAW